jgi:hypothetical protein
VESYSVSIKPSAAKELEALPTLKDRQRATAIIRGLSENPGPGQPQARRRLRCLPLSASARTASSTPSAIGSVVAVIKVAHRREAYR